MIQMKKKGDEKYMNPKKGAGIFAIIIGWVLEYLMLQVNFNSYWCYCNSFRFTIYILN